MVFFPVSGAVGVLEPEVGVDLPGGVGAVQRVEMDAIHVVVQQVGALLGRVVDADPGHGLGIVAGAVHGLEQFGREGAPPASSAMRFMPARLVIGMMPAMIGTLMPASWQRSRKS